MYHKMPNGVEITASVDQINKARAAFGYGPVDTRGMYNSSTHGWIKIKDMDKQHLRNALLKMKREFDAKVPSLSDRELMFALRDGLTDPTYVEMLLEFSRRI